jgi:Carboxypeptidase regulatory-like domain/TonB-dependent Receptor Plug Domain
MRYAAALALGLLGCVVVPLGAQDAPVLRGYLRDSTGSPLARVDVTHQRVTTRSDSTGYFRLTPVPLGRITVRFVREGVLLGELVANVTADTMSDVQVESVRDRIEPRTLRGSVVDSAGKPVRGATIEVVTADMEARADSLGQFTIRALPARRHIVRVRRVGYSPTFLAVDLSDSSSARVRIVVRQYAGQNLGLVVVRGTRGPAHLQGFLRRAANPSGFGKIITAEQINQRNPLRASDMFQALAGVRVAQGGRNGGGTLLGRGGCVMAVFINGFPAPQRGSQGIDQMLIAQDLAGIEVYNGIGGVPAEFMMGPPNSCGTVAVWTK